MLRWKLARSNPYPSAPPVLTKYPTCPASFSAPPPSITLHILDTHTFNHMNNLLRIFSWPRTLGLCLVALFVGKFIMRSIVMDASSTRHVDVVICMLISRGLLELYAAWDRRRRRATATTERYREAALSILLRKTMSFARFCFTLSLGCLYWLLRKPSTSSPMPGTPVHYMKNSQYGTVLAILLISIFADVPVSAMLVVAIEHDPERRHIMHLLFAVLSLVTLILILGDRWYLQGDCHRIDDRTFHISIGKRVAADLPVCRIAAFERISASKADWLKQTGQQARDVIQISPANIADKPNICLTISEGTPIHMRINLFECDLPKYLLLYVDDPQALIQALHANGAISAI